MNKTYIKTLGLFAAAVFMTACSENSWNDKLDGFKEPAIGTDVQSISYDLTDADYSTIAGLSANKSLAVSEDAQKALKAIGTNKCFASEEDANTYIPAFLANSGFPYFTLDNGSSIKVTYALATSGNATAEGVNNAVEYKVTEDDYMAAWESDDDFIAAFAPMTPATKALPKILASAFPDAADGDFVSVNYQQTDANPIFGTVGGGEQPANNYTSVLKDLAEGETVSAKGVVTGISTRGFIVTDNAGSVCYDFGNGFNDDAIAVGVEVEVSGTISVYNQCLQISSNNSYAVTGISEYAYPAPAVYSSADIEAACALTTPLQPVYVEISGTVSISGKYTNIIFEGTEKQGSPYNVTANLKEELVDGEKVTLRGYFVAISGSGKYFNILITEVVRPGAAKAPVGEMASYGVNAVYKFDGKAWKAPSDVIVLQNADYTAMGQSYGNLSGELPSTLLPIFMNSKYPYFEDGTVKVVAYQYYANKLTTTQAKAMVFNAGAWSIAENRENVTSQFNRLNGEWQFDPSVKLNIESKSDAFTIEFYQACVDWVAANVADGAKYVSKYGNNDYYGGSSAYYGNVDIRADKALEQYADGFTGMSEAEITELIKYRFCYEVVPGTLGVLYPDAKPVEGLEVLYTISFVAYTGTSTVETGVWKVTAPGKFEFVSCTWWKEGVAPGK